MCEQGHGRCVPRRAHTQQQYQQHEVIHAENYHCDRQYRQPTFGVPRSQAVQGRQLLPAGCSGTRPKADDHNPTRQIVKRNCLAFDLEPKAGRFLAYGQ